MVVACSERGAARHACYDRAYGGSNRPKPKATPPCFSPSFSAVVTSFLLSPPSLSPNAPVNGAVGLLSSGNWHVCQATVETVLQGGTLRPNSGSSWTPRCNESWDRFCVNSCNYELKPMMMMGNQSVSTASDLSLSLTAKMGGKRRGRREEEENKREKKAAFYSEESEITIFESNDNEETQDKKILNLFV
ncbi:Gag-pol polyprotein-like protein [Hibiscus syriacus]|uniref:Gag-pol polyprotein-like protein n=1 Tax=Hibiscus syriacus TaxID=106335 RepID=A0A6A2ZX38_HIBSY|nr:Gag-pol polyprotein-like protein [Hibiscus syriacus]